MNNFEINNLKPKQICKSCKNFKKIVQKTKPERNQEKHTQKNWTYKTA
jgi:hypothetical protein